MALAVVYVSGDDATLHALTSSPRGEQLGARYALVQTMAEDMAGRGLRFLDLGTAEADAAFLDGWTRDAPAFVSLRARGRPGRLRAADRGDGHVRQRSLPGLP